MKSVVKFVFYALFSLTPFYSQATHIVGGDITYKYLGGDNYEVTLTITRDCFNSSTPFDELASIGVFDSNNNFLFDVKIATSDSAPIPNTANSPCLITPTNICYRIAHYTVVISLPVLAGGYQLAYQRCCRNHSVVNVANVAATGATYYTKVPDRNLFPVNSSPEFQNLPYTFICRNNKFEYDHSAFDPDGDSLVYDLCTPYDGASQSAPRPQPPSSPPYSLISWRAPYTLANLLGGNALRIDTVTGFLTATPSNSGQFVYGVRVREYRNGINIGETRREFQVNVVNCPKIVNSVIQAPTFQCGNNTVSFQSNSTGSASYSWNFGDPTSSGDTSHLANPTYLYPAYGNYNVMLVAFSSVNPNCNDTSFTQLNLHSPLLADFEYTVEMCNDTVTFFDNSSLNSGPIVDWKWNLGDGTISSTQTLTHIYKHGGTYSVKLTSTSQAGCRDSVEISVDVPFIPNADFIALTDSCNPEVILINRSSFATNYFWNLGDSSQSSAPSLKHIYQQEGLYSAELVAQSSSNCFDTIQKTIDYQQAEFLGHFLPSAFTPNGDGRNDLFYVSGATPCEDVELFIYSRWGDLLYHTHDLSIPWDGTHNNKFVPPGVYVYYLRGEHYSRNGIVTIAK